MSVGNILVFLVSLTTMVSTGVLVSARLRLPTRAAYLLSIYLVALASIILVTQIAGTLFLLDSKAFFLVLQAALAGLAGVLWTLNGRPALTGPFAERPIRLDRATRRMASHRWPEVIVLGFCVAAVYTFEVVLNLTIPQNIDDVLTTHLARVGYWLQQGSLYPWDTSEYNIAQTIYPINLSAQVLWSVLFWGSDQLAAMPQWIAGLVAMVAIYGLARQVGGSQPQALFISLLWATLPNVALQAMLTLTDLLATCLFLSMLYLLFLGLQAEHRGALQLSGIAFGLAFGVRQSIVFAIPGLALVAAALGWRSLKREPVRLKLLIVWAVACGMGFLLLGTYMYVVNFIRFDDPLGPSDVVTAYTNADKDLTLLNRAEFVFKNSLYSVGLSVLNLLPGNVLVPIFDAPLESLVDTSPMFQKKYLNPLGHGYAWYGLVSLLLLPIMIREGLRGLSQRHIQRWGLLAISASYVLLIFLSRDFTSAIARYLMLAIGISIPLAAPIYRHGRGVFWLTIIAVISLLWAVGSDGSKRAADFPNMIHKDRAEIQTLLMLESAEFLPVFEQVVPDDAAVGLMVEGKFPHSPLFGEHFTRRVEVIHTAPEILDSEWFAKYDVDFIILDHRDFSPEIAPSVYQITESVYWVLLSTNPPPADMAPLR
ncbi:MAG: glycosyltransferase family 39 protein [Anaerolineae bacterium]|nr:glycosyltransferase family 39 protein [Anaerolineae bacterium]